MDMVIHLHMHPSIPLMDISTVMTQVQDSLDGETEVIFGTTSDEALNEFEIKITIVATGFESNNYIDPQDDTKESNKSKQQQNQDSYEVPPLLRNYEIQYQL